MRDVDYEQLVGQITAHHLLLRALYTSWAEKAADPIETAREGISGLMASYRKKDPPQSDFEDRVWDEIDRELARFLMALEARLVELGHRQ